MQKPYLQENDKSIILKKHRALVSLLKAHKYARSFAGAAPANRLEAPPGPSTDAAQGDGNAQAAERTKTARLASPLGIPLGPSTDDARSTARDFRGERGCHAKADPLAEAIQLANARPSCASFGRVSQGSLHHACQPASLLQ